MNELMLKLMNEITITKYNEKDFKKISYLHLPILEKL
jgi:hypothetical protein